MRIPVHREGWIFILLFAGLAAVLWLVWLPLGILGTAVALWSLWFFRDPEREVPDIEGAIVSPADGRCLPITRAAPPAELGMGEEPRTRVSIFMNIFNVHVNRAPASGVVTQVAYRPGRFFNASFDKASIHNERSAARMRTDAGDDIAFVQIAGLVARRIRSALAPGRRIRVGERFGIIRFGSRLDVYLPDHLAPMVAEGQHMVAGETVIAVAAPHDAPAAPANETLVAT